VATALTVNPPAMTGTEHPRNGTPALLYMKPKDRATMDTMPKYTGRVNHETGLLGETG